MGGKHRNRIQGKLTARCAHPGCCTTIREGTWNFSTGLCTRHQPAEPEAVRPGREKVRVALVHLVPGCSSLASCSLVSLPREPWL